MKRSVLICCIFVLLSAFCCSGFAEEFEVSTAAELIDALAGAGSNGEDDTILLAAGTYETSGDQPFAYEASAFGEGSLTLTADGEAVLDGGGSGQVLSVRSDFMTDITLDGLAIVSADAGENGGGASIRIAAGNIAVSGCRFDDNVSVGNGGALWLGVQTNGSFAVSGCRFTGNSSPSGGAMCVTTAGGMGEGLLENNVFIGNRAANTGGAAVFSSLGRDLTITGNEWTGNEAGSSGGAFYFFNSIGDAVMKDNVFTANMAENGGGFFGVIQHGDLLMADCDFDGNVSSGDMGGGAWVQVLYGDLDISGCLFDGNVASGDMGGGAFLMCHLGDIRIERNSFTRNDCGGGGGGLSLISHFGDLVFGDNLVAGNLSEGSGGGACLELNTAEMVHVVNNTVTGNVASGDSLAGGGLYVNCSSPYTLCSVTNNIVWGNVASGVSDDVVLRDNGNINSFSVTNNDFSVLSTDFTASSDLYESDNVDENPLFVSSTDFHLQADSPVIDLGDDGAPSIGEVDLDGKVRVHGDTVDMGAYEFGSSMAGDGDEGDTGGSSGGCNTGSFLPSLLLLAAPLVLLRKKR